MILSLQILGNEYVTPYDLWKAKYTGPVKATLTCRAPKGFPDARSIYTNDEVCLYDMPTLNDDLPKLAGSEGDTEEIDVVRLKRSFSTTSEVLGSIFVPSYLPVHFREQPPSLGEHTLDHVTRFGKIPMNIELSTITGGDTMTNDDNNLLNDGPLKIVGECEYSVVYVTVYDPRNLSSEIPEAREIPDFLGVQVRPIRERIPGVRGDIKNYNKVNPYVYYLTLKQYSNLIDEDEDRYTAIDKGPICDPSVPPKSEAILNASASDSDGCRIPLRHSGRRDPYPLPPSAEKKPAPLPKIPNQVDSSYETIPCDRSAIRGSKPPVPT